MINKERLETDFQQFFADWANVYNAEAARDIAELIKDLTEDNKG